MAKTLVYLVWNETRTEAFATGDRKLAEALCAGPEGMSDYMHLSEACRFCYRYGRDACTIEEVSDDGQGT
jgi:hypothetical protein